ncbi:MAG TPA: 3-dehydroquinate synthase family protein, partial [Thalassobaculum sp.]
MSDVETVEVDLADRRYAIRVGPGLLARAGEELADLLAGRNAVVVVDEAVAGLHLPALERALAGGASAVHALTVPSGESAKSMAGLADLLDRMLALGIDRRTVVVALGGGVTGDLAGFAAAVALRGLDFVQIPTTLLAQVDSSVGGKTGVNSRHGKNLIGAFHQPRRVLIDTDVLDTLPRRELLAGYAEVVKYGAIGDVGFFEWLEANGRRLLDGDADARRHA